MPRSAEAPSNKYFNAEEHQGAIRASFPSWPLLSSSVLLPSSELPCATVFPFTNVFRDDNGQPQLMGQTSYGYPAVILPYVLVYAPMLSTPVRSLHLADALSTYDTQNVHKEKYSSAWILKGALGKVADIVDILFIPHLI